MRRRRPLAPRPGRAPSPQPGRVANPPRRGFGPEVPYGTAAQWARWASREARREDVLPAAAALIAWASAWAEARGLDVTAESASAAEVAREIYADFPRWGRRALEAIGRVRLALEGNAPLGGASALIDRAWTAWLRAAWADARTTRRGTPRGQVGDVAEALSDLLGELRAVMALGGESRPEADAQLLLRFWEDHGRIAVRRSAPLDRADNPRGHPQPLDPEIPFANIRQWALWASTQAGRWPAFDATASLILWTQEAVRARGGPESDASELLAVAFHRWLRDPSHGRAGAWKRLLPDLLGALSGVEVPGALHLFDQAWVSLLQALSEDNGQDGAPGPKRQAKEVGHHLRHVMESLRGALRTVGESAREAQGMLLLRYWAEYGRSVAEIG